VFLYNMRARKLLWIVLSVQATAGNAHGGKTLEPPHYRQAA